MPRLEYPKDRREFRPKFATEEAYGEYLIQCRCGQMVSFAHDVEAKTTTG